MECGKLLNSVRNFPHFLFGGVGLLGDGGWVIGVGGLKLTSDNTLTPITHYLTPKTL